MTLASSQRAADRESHRRQARWRGVRKVGSSPGLPERWLPEPKGAQGAAEPAPAVSWRERRGQTGDETAEPQGLPTGGTAHCQGTLGSPPWAASARVTKKRSRPTPGTQRSYEGEARHAFSLREQPERRVPRQTAAATSSSLSETLTWRHLQAPSSPTVGVLLPLRQIAAHSEVQDGAHGDETRVRAGPCSLQQPRGVCLLPGPGPGRAAPALLGFSPFTPISASVVLMPPSLLS